MVKEKDSKMSPNAEKSTSVRLYVGKMIHTNDTSLSNTCYYYSLASY